MDTIVSVLFPVDEVSCSHVELFSPAFSYIMQSFRISHRKRMYVTLLYDCIVQKVPQSFHGGKFQSAQELDIYERMWHEHIFTGCYSNIHDEVCCC